MNELFINESFIKNLSICDDLIDYYKNSNKKTKGAISYLKSTKIDENCKKSTDVVIDYENAIKSDVIKNYLIELQNILNLYIDKYKFSKNNSSFALKENFNIQHYKPNEGFFSWHCERGCSNEPYSSRHLVWMTYLNDVEDAGETEFYYQKLKIKPEKGKTVIFPADWTHTHRGIVSKTQEKYIITGWFNYINEV